MIVKQYFSVCIFLSARSTVLQQGKSAGQVTTVCGIGQKKKQNNTNRNA